jgi:spermidine synthase
MLKIYGCILIILIVVFIYVISKQVKYKESFLNEVQDASEFERYINSLNPTELYSSKSKYQNIKVIKFDKNKIGLDKCLMLGEEIQLCNASEHKYHETIVHVAASYIKSLKNVLIIGGGDCMTLREIMKYPSINKVVMLELDKKVIDVSKKYFNVNDYQNDPRVDIIIGDATKSIHKLKGMFDLIIIDTTEDSYNNNPIDSKEFFSICAEKLNDNGILVKNGEDMKNYINLSNIFEHTKVIKYDEKIWGDLDYKFILASKTIDFDNSKRRKHNIDIKFYQFNKHDDFMLQT